VAGKAASKAARSFAGDLGSKRAALLDQHLAECIPAFFGIAPPGQTLPAVVRRHTHDMDHLHVLFKRFCLPAMEAANSEAG